MILTKEFTFDCAHSLINYNGKCKYIHGHTYKLKVFIYGSPIKDEKSQNGGMICDFEKITQIIKTYLIDKFDHSLITTKKEFFFEKLSKNTKYSYLDYPFDIKTTCEMISLQILSDLLKTKISIEAIELWETPTSSCYTTLDDLKEYLKLIIK